MANSVYDTLYNWARKTGNSLSGVGFVASVREPAEEGGDGLVYRLREWPVLQPSHRTAGVFRALSVMSNRPVNRHWMLRHSKLRAPQLDALLRRLVAQGAVEALDVSRYPRAS
jgi:hypothetical protein